MDSLDILVLEDDKGHQRLIQNILSEYDFVRKIHFASKMHEALHLLKHEFFNAIITDYYLDEQITGIDFLAAVRAEGLEIPSLILTGIEKLVDQKDAMQYGCFAVVSKLTYYQDGALDEVLDELKRRGKYVSFEHLKGIYVPANFDETFQMVRSPEIILIEATVGKGVTIYTESNAIKTALSVKDYGNYLAPWRFGKTSRSAVVNLIKVEAFDGNYVYLQRNIHNINSVKVKSKEFITYWIKYKNG